MCRKLDSCFRRNDRRMGAIPMIQHGVHGMPEGLIQLP
jgi:hypothetical protein